jgi:hypothetical protein
VGGSDGEEISSMIMDAAGDIYASGNTASADFPVTAGAYDETYNGTDTAPYPNPGDIFVVKLSGDLTTLHAATYCGGSAHEYSRAIALDASGNVVVAGSTGSGDFPATAGAYDETHNPGGTFNEDGVVARFSGDLSQLVAATYLGGTHDDFVETFVLDSTGAALVAGWTLSRNYPVVPGSYDTTYAGVTYEAFVSRLSADLSTLEASTFLGGTNWDFAYTMTIDGSDNVYVGGHTASTDYPTTSGAFDETYNGVGGAGVGDDIFVSKLDAGLTILKASTYLGGSDWEHTTCMTIGGGRLYLTGSTSSADFPMPVNSFDATYNGGVTLEGDLCAVCLDSDLAIMKGATYLGGNDREYYETCVACTPACDAVYVAGSTKSTDVPVSPGAFDNTHNGGYDGILACFDEFMTYGVPFPVPNIKANGQDFPLTVPASVPVRVTVFLDPNDLEGVKQDWWIFVERNASATWWWRYPAKNWTKSSSPLRATGAALRTVADYAVLDRTLPPGQYVFTFAVDADNMTFEGTYADTVTVDVQ